MIRLKKKIKIKPSKRYPYFKEELFKGSFVLFFIMYVPHIHSYKNLHINKNRRIRFKNYLYTFDDRSANLVTLGRAQGQCWEKLSADIGDNLQDFHC